MLTKKKKSNNNKKETNKITYIIGAIIIVLFIIALKSYVDNDQNNNQPNEETEKLVENGDIISLKFTIRDDENKLLDTNYKHIAENESFEMLTTQETLDFQVGLGKVMVGIEEALLGMKVGEKKSIEIPPEKAYGKKLDNANITWPSIILRQKYAKVNRFFIVGIADLEKNFGESILNHELNPGERFFSNKFKVEYIVQKKSKTEILFYINASEGDTVVLPGTVWNSTITWINETEFRAIQNPSKGDAAITQWGMYNVLKTDKNGYALYTQLKKGDQIYVNNKLGTVTDVDDNLVYFDSNHPLAGKIFYADLEVYDIVKT